MVTSWLLLGKDAIGPLIQNLPCLKKILYLILGNY
jgi:hypothetical protein